MKLRQILAAGAAIILTCGPAWAYEMTYQNMFLALMKLNPSFDYENSVAGYMQVYRPTVWQRTHNDEFERRGAEEETLQMMKKSAGSFNLDDPIVIHTAIQFGEYDFKQHQFALNPFSDASFFPVNYCCVNGLPNQIQLYFSNPDIINGLPMDDQAAKLFINRHKQYGNVNRQLNADISVKLVSAKGDDQLVGEVVKVVLHDPMNGNAVLETINPRSSS